MAEFKLGRLRFVWKNVWTTGTAYVKDDVVKYGGSAFVCIAAHTANSNFDTDLTGNKWQKMSAGVDFKNSPWSPSTVYKENDIVKYGGKLYIALSNHTSNSLLNGGFYLDSARWTLLSDGTEWKGNWQTSFYYKLGDTVKYNSSTYICLTPHTSAATATLGLEDDSENWQLVGEGFKWRGDWSDTTRYIVNDVVKYGPNLWLCETAHTSTSEFVQANWTLFVSGLEFEDSWSSTELYQEGDIVTYGGYSYVAKTQHSNSIPPASATDWTLLTTGYNTRGRYNEALAYKVGDVILYGGRSFVAEVEVSPGESPYANSGKWQLVTDGIRWLGNWSESPTEITYKIGDAVRYLASTYVCVDEHVPSETGLNINRPDLDTEGDYWNALAEGDEQNVLARRADLVTRNAIQNQRLPKGQTGTFLKAGPVDLEWSTVGNITRVFYVSTDGIDSPERGTTLNDPWRTIKYACNRVRTVVVPTRAQPAVINVKTGVYNEDFPISIPKYTSLVGDELRMSIIEPTPETSGNDKFYMRDSTTVRNFTFRAATGANLPDGTTDTLTPPNQYGTRRPTGGAWIGLDPGEGPNDESVWVGERSPYIQNVTLFGDYCVGQKIDGALHNGGNKSITSNDFTTVLSDSIGAWCTNQGRGELVSVFTYYSYIGYLCENGGVIRATNGNNSYGTYGSVSEGVDPTEISRTAEVDNRRLNAQVDRVQTNGNSLLYLEYLNAGENYTEATHSFTGPGSANVSTTANFEDGGVCEIRVLDDGDNYLTVTNNAQQGTTIDVRLSASDTTVTGGYNGMRITLIDGAGAGQYAIVNNFDGGSKDLFVLKESFAPLTITSTASGTNTVTMADNTTLAIDSPIMFVGTLFGGLSASTVYYVKAKPTSTEITLYTDTVTKTVTTLSNGSGTALLYQAGWDVVVKDLVYSVSAATKTDPVRITTNSNHGLIDGFAVTFSSVGGMTELNGNTYYVSRVNNTQFDLYTSYTLLTSVDGTGFGTYTSGGTIDGGQLPLPFLDTTTRYIIEPRPVFSTGTGAAGTPERTLGINAVTIVSGGQGFTTPPTISLAGPDLVDGNETAQGTTVISGGVDSVVVQSKGTGYTSAPTLSFVGGGLPANTTDWVAGLEVELGTYIRTTARRVYEVTVAGELGGSTPTHTSGTSANGTVSLLYLGRIASATASITSTIKEVNLADGGLGYTSPPSVIVTGVGGSGAIISAQISQVIGEITVTSPGSGYTSAPQVTLVGGEPLTFATAVAVLSATVTSITVTEGGSGYIPSTTTVSLTGGGGTNATATAVIDFGNWIAGVTPGVITSITVVTGGSGYSTPPTVVIEGEGEDATASSNIVGTVDEIQIINRGRGYQTTPAVQITGGGGTNAAATAVRTGAINTLTVVDGGTGWSGTPDLSFTGGGGSGASATVTAMDTVIDTVTVDDEGENYTSNPALAVRGGGGTGAILRPRIDGKVVSVSISDPGSDYSSDPIISFIGGGNYRSATAGLRYYANASALVAIGISQRDQTLAAIERAGVVAKAVAANTNPTTLYQTGISRTAGGGGYVAPVGIANAIDTWINTVYFTIENGEQLTKAANLLSINRKFIVTEIRKYLDLNFSGEADDTWNRDIGLVVDAVVKDISTRGVNNSLSCGISQVFLTDRSGTGQTAALDALETMISFCQDVVQNIVIVPSLDLPLVWEGVWEAAKAYDVNDVVVVNGATYICDEVHVSSPLFTTDLDLDRWVIKTDGQRTNLEVFEPDSLVAIENCITLIKGIVQRNPGSVTYSTVSNLILSNREFIKAEVIGFINSEYEDFDYNQALCARDTGFIVEALSYDLANGNVTAEPVATATTTGVVARITVDEAGEGYSEGVTLTISDPFTGSAWAASTSVTNGNYISYTNAQNVKHWYQVTATGTTGTTPPIHDIGSASNGTATLTFAGTTAKALPVIDEFTGEITDYEMSNKGKGYPSAPITLTITPDTGSGALARCRLAGSNVARIVIINPGSGYTSGPFMKLIDPNNTEDARFRVRVADGVLTQPTFLNRGTGWLNADGFVEGDGYADISQTGSFIYVKSLTNLPTPGANIQFAGDDTFYKLVTVRDTVGPSGLIGARQLLLANKQFIQEEILSYLENFTYNQATCSRDTGLILDALGEDIVYGSNARILAALQQYRRGTYANFQDQRFQTAFALEYLSELISQSQKPATLAALTNLKSAISNNLDSNATAISRSNTNMDIIYNILDNGLSVVPTISTPDPTGYNTGYFNARRLLLANRDFIIEEITAWIQGQITAGAPGFVGLNYNVEKCERDVGYIIDALRYDLTYGGNLMSLLAGNSYYSYTELQIDQNDKTATLAAYNHLRTILGDILQAIEITKSVGNNLTQDDSGTAGSSAAAAFAQDRINDIRTTINTGTAPANILPDTGWVDGGLLAARSTLITQKTTIQENVITYIENNYPTLVFNRDTCSRDVGYIIDSIGYDIIFGSNFQSIKSGMAYYRANASNVLTGFGTVANLLSPLTEWMKNEEFYKTLPAPVMPDGNANTEENLGKDLLLANREFIGAQAWRYFVNTNPSITVDSTLFRQELEQIVLSIAHDLTYTGNAEVIRFASSFYSGSTLRIPGYSGTASTIKTEYLDLLSNLSTVLQDVVQNNIVTPAVGMPTGVTQDRSLPPGDAGTAVEVDRLMDDFIAIINLTTSTIGITVTETDNTFVDYPGALISARDSIEDSRTNLRQAVNDWIDDEFVNFTFDHEICARDTGLIVQAISDDLFGDVAKSIEAGQRYYAATAALVISEQKPQTIAAIDRINTIAQKVIRNETYTRTQNNRFQERFPSITGGAEGGPVIEDRLRLIRRILETGSDLDRVKQLLLDNKEYIKAEVIAYINASYENLDYDQEICARDAGFIVDALVYDIYGGFSRSREAGLRYYSSPSALIAITDQLTPTRDAILHLRDLVQSILIDEEPNITFQEVEPRISPTGNYSIPQVSNLVIDQKINDSIDELLNVIETGPSALPAGLYTARFQISPPMSVFKTPAHDTATTVRSKYSQVRLTGHDFLNIGTGNKSDTNYPGIPVNVPDQQNEVVEVGGGRVFYTSTDQDGNFRVGELFRVEQSTGIATLNADAFNLSGLNELSLGGITLGGTNAVIREFSTDATFFANSDNIVPTQKAIKTYIQSALGSGGGNIAVNAVIAGQVFVSGDEVTTIGNIPLRFTSTGSNLFTGAVESTSSGTGTIIVTGGIGLSGNVFSGGTITATQFVTATGGIQSTAIGNVTRSTAAFTTLTANGATTVTANTQSEDATTGALVVSGGVGVGGNLNVAGSFNVGSLSSSGIDNTPIGSIGRSSGAFTTLAANNSVTFTANVASSSTGTGTLVVTGGVGVSGAITLGGALTANGSNVSMSLQPTGTGTVTIAPNTTGNINNMNIGATTRGSAAFTTLAANNSVTFTANVASTTTSTGTLVVTGGVGVSGQMTASSIVETSSITLKENINPIQNALENIMKLSGVTYDRIDTKETEAGLIAEWVDEILPSMVTKDSSGKTVGIKYTKMIAYLIESIKSLKQEIDELKGKK